MTRIALVRVIIGGAVSMHASVIGDRSWPRHSLRSVSFVQLTAFLRAPGVRRPCSDVRSRLAVDTDHIQRGRLDGRSAAECDASQGGQPSDEQMLDPRRSLREAGSPCLPSSAIATAWRALATSNRTNPASRLALLRLRILARASNPRSRSVGRATLISDGHMVLPSVFSRRGRRRLPLVGICDGHKRGEERKCHW